MRISKKQFYIITVLFLMLPFSVHWRLFLFGTKTKGVVTEQVYDGTYLSNRVLYSVIRFETNKEYIEFNTPENVRYKIGREVTIIYNADKPSQFIMLTFAGLIFHNKMIIPGVAIIMWFAYYLTYKSRNRK